MTNLFELEAFYIVFYVYFFALNIFSFIIMKYDKTLSKKRRARRISEKSFFILSLVGGSAGVFIAMQLFRHKTKHWNFLFGIPCILICQIVLILFLI